MRCAYLVRLEEGGEVAHDVAREVLEQVAQALEHVLERIRVGDLRDKRPRNRSTEVYAHVWKLLKRRKNKSSPRVQLSRIRVSGALVPATLSY